MDELEETYETLEEIPENYRKLYKEHNAADGTKSWRFGAVKSMFGSAERKRLGDENGAHRLKAKEYKTSLDAWSSLGESPDKVRELLDRIPELETAAATGGSKSKEAVDKLVETRMATEVTKHQRVLSEKDKAINTLQDRVNRYENAARTSYVLDAVRGAIAAFKGGKFNQSAVEDVLMYAERHFEVESDHDSETGELLISGLRTKDKVGVTPGVEVGAWLAEMVAKKSHWLEPSDGVGGGPDGRRGNGGLGSNPWAADNWNITDQAKYTHAHGVDKAKQMAKVAGAEWGATTHPKNRHQREQQRR